MFDVNTTSLSLRFPYSSATRYLLLILHTVILTIGILGNGLVVYGSIKHHAIKMEKISLLFIQNIAITDVCITIMTYGPAYLTLITQHWVFGGVGCYVIAMYLVIIACQNEIFVIGAMSVYRLWMLKKTRSQREKIPLVRIKIIMLVLFIMSCTQSAVIIYAPFDFKAEFSPPMLACMSSNFLDSKNSTILIFTLIDTGCYVALPMMSTLIANTGILYIVLHQSKRVGRGVLDNKSTVLTLMLICGTFLASYSPFLIKFILDLSGHDTPNWFITLGTYAPAINVIVNPFFYFFTNNRFKTWIRGLVGLNNAVVPNTSVGDTETEQ